jgi:hypothetical protein
MSNVNGKSGMIPTESETTRTVGNFSHGSRETPETFASPMEADRSEKARCHTSDMHVAGESDSSIVPEKPANKGGVPPPAELAEGRELTKENTGQSLLDRTQGRNADGTPFVPRSRGLLGVREAARKDLSERAVCRSASEVRAVCGSSARTDLCGGWPARAVPTAIVFDLDRREKQQAIAVMPRRLRFAGGGYVYHVLNRAVVRDRIFVKNRD